MSVKLNIPGRIFLSEEDLGDIRGLFKTAGDGTVDELGFRPLYLTISNELFPWCSTLTSRSRYFFFIAASISIALERVVSELKLTGIETTAQKQKIAMKYSIKLEKQIREYEKWISFTLCALYPNESGIFGKRTVKREMSQGLRPFKDVKKILKDNSRYPLPIYKSSCIALGMFSCHKFSSSQMILDYIDNAQPINKEWALISSKSRAEIERILDFWENTADKDATLNEMSKKLKKEKVKKRFFRGFLLTKGESKFLQKKMDSMTEYISELTLNQNRFESEEHLPLAEIAKIVSSIQYKELFSNASDIDVATKYFRDIYNTICLEGDKAATKYKYDIKEIERSIKTLNKSNSDMKWKGEWDLRYSEMLAEWTSLFDRNGHASAKLVFKLKERAELIVFTRQGCKIPPHKKRSDDNVFDDTDVKDSSFRLHNASLLIKDIAKGLYG